MKIKTSSGFRQKLRHIVARHSLYVHEQTFAQLRAWFCAWWVILRKLRRMGYLKTLSYLLAPRYHFERTFSFFFLMGLKFAPPPPPHLTASRSPRGGNRRRLSAPWHVRKSALLFVVSSFALMMELENSIENNDSLHEKDKVQGPKKRQSRKRCVVTFFSKTNADGVSLHQFPKDEKVLRKWISFVRIKREPNSWTPGTGHICSDHFTAGSYEGFAAKLAGYASKLILKKTAVPSIQAAPTPEQVNTARRLKRKLPPTEEKPNSKGKDPNDELQSYKTPKRSSRALSKLTANRVSANVWSCLLILCMRDSVCDHILYRLPGRRGSTEFLVGVCLRVAQIQTLFETKTSHFPGPFSALTSKIHTPFQNWVLNVALGLRVQVKYTVSTCYYYLVVWLWISFHWGTTF